MSENTRRVIRTSTPIRIVRKATQAATSVAKTAVGIDLAPPTLIRKRLAVCAKCPGGHATFHKNGRVDTCGPMVEGLKAGGKAPCGCILRLKARDLKAKCPLGWW